MSHYLSLKLFLILVLTGIVGWSWITISRLKRQLKERAKEVDLLKMRGAEFVANVSHELKTPLTSIKGFTETLKAGAIHDHQKAVEFLTRIENNADRLSLLINDILDLSKIESPNTHLDWETFNPAEDLEDIMKDFAPKLERRQQSLSIHNEVSSVVADRKLFGQALRNLVENAHRYCGNGTLIEIFASQVVEQGETYNCFVVSDNGPGISPDDLPRVFERFYRADKSRNRQSGGTGLGLAIVKHIMMSHGGFVRVASEPFKGAKFSLYFPLEASSPISS